MNPSVVMNRFTALARVAASLCVVLGSGCAIHYHDRATGTEHLWGIGHLKMRADVRTDAPTVIVHSVQTAGLAIGLQEGRRSVSFGWTDTQTARVLAEPAALSLSYPPRNLFGLDATGLRLQDAAPVPVSR